MVNGEPAKIVSSNAGVTDWQITIGAVAKVVAFANDKAGNAEPAAHEIIVAALVNLPAARMQGMNGRKFIVYARSDD